jgi:hypothetical protein
MDTRIGKAQARGALLSGNHRVVDTLEGLLGEQAIG